MGLCELQTPKVSNILSSQSGVSKNAFSNTTLTLILINLTCYLTWCVVLRLKASAEHRPPRPPILAALVCCLIPLQTVTSATDLELCALSWFPFPSWSFLSYILYQLHNKYVCTSLFLPPDWDPHEGRNNCKLRTHETYFMTDWAFHMYPSQGADSVYKATAHGQIEELSPAAKMPVNSALVWVLSTCYVIRWCVQSMGSTMCGHLP